MKHLGDITKISGYTAPIVDCIIGGSPCQDLSVAGKRAGLEGERSGLFMEQIRIVKEMRLQDERNGRTDVNIRPRYMVWENVPGAFSSNKGEDFRVVLEEIARVKDENASVPLPDKGKWTTSGCIVGDGWSIAWRVLDAQFWGVPQRRRRIALVADFGGQSASEILFVRSCVSGHSDESQPKRKDSTTDATGSTGANDCLGFDGYNAELTGSKQATLGVNCGMSTGRNGVLCHDIGEARLRTPSEYKDLAPTLTQRCGTGGNNTPAVITFEPGIASREGGHIYEGVSGTLRANAGDNQMATAYTMQDREEKEGGGKGALVQKDRSASLRTVNSQYLFQLVAKGPSAVCYWDGGQVAGTLTANNASGQQRMPDKENFNCVIQGINGDKAGTLDSSYYKGCGMRQGVEREIVAVPSNTRYIVRRLTPLECERLQGYPDGWTQIGEVVGYDRQIDERTGEEYVQAIYEYIDDNGKKHKTSDAARYKALGNSIALPPWKWVLKRICACYERDATMASLFDGIGGFPYLWEQLNGKGTCLWASEIEEFPMAVTKVRIGE